MSDSRDKFLGELNPNIRVVHKICRIYFRDKDERDDVFQEIMYQLWKSYGKFQGESKFSTWMYKVALNTALTHIRKINKIPEKEKLKDAYHQISEIPQEDKAELLYDSINTLNAIDKAIIFLYLEQNSYDEIAAITGLTKSNVSVKIVRIKKVLEERLKRIK
ncbi:MAG: sigma-70 family RNA polymerase sigma factor [Cyclobacteriaceae bacterium]|nr:sigma-70 family RNA polymerase sigma factor [Cyclobacteriaceae bacterium]